MPQSLSRKEKRLLASLVERSDMFHGPGKQDHHARDKQDKPHQKDDSAEVHSVVGPKAAPSTYHPKEPEKGWYRRIPWWKFLKGLGIVAVVVYAVITYFQWRDLRHNFEVDQRSWVKAVIQVPQIITVPAWEIKLRNVGKSPVVEAGMMSTFEILDVRKPPSLTQEPKVVSAGILSTIFPGDEAPSEARLAPDVTEFTDAQKSDLLAGKKYIAVWGRVQYRDQFGLHWTQFCNWKAYNKDATVNAANCVIYNSVGEGGVLRITTDWK